MNSKTFLSRWKSINKYPGLILVLLVLFEGVYYFNVFSPFLAFSSLYYEYWCAYFNYFILLFLFLNGFAFRRKIVVILHTIIGALPACYALIGIVALSLLLFTMPKSFYDNSQERLHQIQWRGSAIYVYRTGAWATDANGILIREEQPLGLGLLLVHHLYKAHRRDSVVIHSQGEKLVLESIGGLYEHDTITIYESDLRLQ